MRKSTIVMIAFAVVFGLLAVFVAQTWLDNQTEMRMKSLNAQKKPVSTRSIIVGSAGVLDQRAFRYCERHPVVV